MKLGCRFPVYFLVRGLVTVWMALLLVCGVTNAAAQTNVVKPINNSGVVIKQQPVSPVVNPGTVSVSGSSSTAANPAPQRMRGTTNAQRQAAAANFAQRRAAQPKTPSFKIRANALVGVPGNPGGPATLDQLYFSGMYPNYATSPLPNVADTVNWRCGQLLRHAQVRGHAAAAEPGE